MIPGVTATPELQVARGSSADEELVIECLRGNQEAWNSLVDKYRNLVYSVPAKYRMPPEDAADVFQAVWTDLFAELPRLRNPAALRSWLITVAGHKCYQWKQQQSMLNRTSDGEIESTADPRVSLVDWRHEVEREQMLRDAMAELPPRCRAMVHMLFFEHPPRPYKEVAERLGLAEGSIGFIRGRCLTKLRASLEKMGF